MAHWRRSEAVGALEAKTSPHAAGAKLADQVVLAELLGLERLSLQLADLVAAENRGGDADAEDDGHVERRGAVERAHDDATAAHEERREERHRGDRGDDGEAALPGVRDEDAVEDDEHEPAEGDVRDRLVHDSFMILLVDAAEERGAAELGVMEIREEHRHGPEQDELDAAQHEHPAPGDEREHGADSDDRGRADVHRPVDRRQFVDGIDDVADEERPRACTTRAMSGDQRSRPRGRPRAPERNGGRCRRRGPCTGANRGPCRPRAWSSDRWRGRLPEEQRSRPGEQ